MKIEIWKLDPAGEQLTGTEPETILDVESEEIAPQTPVGYELVVRPVSGELLVNGSLTATVRFRCSRCAENFALPVSDRTFACAIEFGDKYQSVDLTPFIREAMILAFPTYPVCSPECRGLCPHCGANLNRERCRCTSPASGDTWHALDRLKLKTGESHGGPKKEKIEE